MSRRSHEQRLRPRFLYREQPMGVTDSGWSALVGDESPDELDDPDAMLSQPVGELVERWPELRGVLETGRPESQWVWDDERQTYVSLAPPGC
ncbi:MAG TPA: DUF2185 domain-containing protein [Nocardioides sp.]|nr:DUF2185 domain-containing protein [Nocardioides sp.]